MCFGEDCAIISHKLASVDLRPEAARGSHAHLPIIDTESINTENTMETKFVPEMAFAILAGVGIAVPSLTLAEDSPRNLK